jgi:hypothetical protein
MADYLELPVGDDGYIRVEVAEQGLVSAGAADILDHATERFEDAMMRVVQLGEDAVRRARAAAQPPDAIEVELGLKLTAKAGFVIAESTGEANFKVTLKWTRSN